jgi:hypothetical protein
VKEVGRLALSKGPNKVSVSLPSHEDGKRSDSLNAVFCSYLEIQMMDMFHEPSDSERFIYNFCTKLSP